ncbi:RimJ/RimL family protein N-acetyltransferase [Pullulanibacillus pueri]|uniref:N-acetyltransferase n=1 Tax=Pullulanibacillus pueri TaxID=1437324 RepID=A0A8J2ZVI4_9BACL|nr:GNAT family N-acetyltransferase [Pullulanibacillus pueri]MBM7680940.1 RimJ/RimL family protein N-acetyltransferase [Pullulanibacillus pueri]GGH81418.1 N-acetyltransferase [Pullulanibacillus pueri]
MEIRRLNGLDAEMYLKLRLEALQTNPEAFASSYEEEKEYSIDIFENRLNSLYSYTFGAFDNGSLIGSVSLVREQKNKMKHRATIYAMYVTPEKRGKTIAKKLMMTVLEQVKDIEGVEQIYLSVMATNTPAKTLYNAFGFNTYGMDKKALKVNGTYYDEELMVRYV